MSTLLTLTAVISSIVLVNGSPTYLNLNAQATGINLTAKFCPGIDDGINITCVLDHGDCTGQSYCEPVFSAVACTQYAYNRSGYYTVWEHCVTEDTHVNDSTTIYVGNKIINMEAGGPDGEIFIPISFTETKDVIVKYEQGTDVIMNITNAVTGDLLVYENVSEFSFTFTFQPSNFSYQIGQHAICFTLSNPLSSETLCIVFDLEEDILGYVNTNNVKTYMLVADMASFDLKMTNGSNVIKALEFKTEAYVEKHFGIVRQMCLNYTFVTTGKYEFSVVVSNMVSHHKHSYVVYIYYPVNNITVDAKRINFQSECISLNYTMESDALIPMGTLKSNETLGDGTVRNHDLTPFSTTNTKYESPCYQWAVGSYPVEVVVYSETTSLNFSWTQIVEYPVRGLELVHELEVPLSEGTQNISIRMTDNSVSPLNNVTCEIDVDGTLYSKVFDMKYGVNSTIIHTFAADGNKTITFNCSNQLSWQSGISYINLYTDCFDNTELFSATYKNPDTPVVMLVTNVNQITAKVVVAQMCRNSSRHYWWSLWWVDPATKVHIKERYYTFPENQPKATTLQIAPEAIPPGLYKSSCLVNLTDIPGAFVEDYLYFDMRLPPFTAGILGGSIRMKGKTASTTINAKDASSDSASTRQRYPFQYAWICRKLSKTHSEITDILARYEKDPGLDVNTLGVACTYPTLSNTGEITFDAVNVEPDFWYCFEVTLTKASDTRTAKAIQCNYVMNLTPPTVCLKCLRNCQKKVAKDTRLILEVCCDSCTFGSTTYEWTVEKYNPATKLFETYENFPSLLDTGTDADTLGVKPNALLQDITVKFSVNVTVQGNPDVATAEYIVSINQPPYDGTCQVEPTEGLAAVTPFTVRCKDWLDEGSRPLRGNTAAIDGVESLTYTLYQIRNTSTSSELVTSLVRESSESVLRTVLYMGDPDIDCLTDLIVRITDMYYGYTDVYLKTKVCNPIFVNDSMSPAQIKNVLATFLTSNLEEAVLTNDHMQIMIQAATIASVLTSIPIQNYTVYEVGAQPDKWNKGLIDTNEFGNGTIPYDVILTSLLKETEDKIQSALVEGINNLTNTMLASLQSTNTTTYYAIKLGASAFTDAISNIDTTSDVAATNAAEALYILTEGYTNLTDEKLKDFFGKSDPGIEQTAIMLFDLCNSMVNVTVPSNIPDLYFALSLTSTADGRALSDFLARVNKDEAYALTEASDMTPDERVGLLMFRSQIANYNYVKAQKLAESTMRSMIDNSASIIQMLLGTVPKGAIDNYDYKHFIVTMTKNYLKNIDQIPLIVGDSNVTVDGIGKPDLIIKYSTTMFRRNPYIFGDTKTATAISSDVHRVTVTDQNNNPVNVPLVKVNQPCSNISSGMFMPFFTPDDASKLIYHEFWYRHIGDYVCVHIDQEYPDPVYNYDVFIRCGAYPNHLVYDHESYLVADRDWMTCISPEYFHKLGICYVGLRPKAIPGTKSFVWTPTTGPFVGKSYNVSDPRLVPYVLTITTAGCLTWDKTKEKWRGNKCKMDWHPPKSEVECTCNTDIGMTFGNTFYVPPNTIDFSTAFLKFSAEDQAAVLSLLILVLLSYIILMIWARHQDKKDVVRWGVTPLIDNYVDDTYYYMITVYTGLRKGAGTASRIGFIVAGSEGDTGVRELYDGVRREISTASVTHFLMSTTHPLGDLDYMYIWHDNSGEGDKGSWYLNRIDIEDIQEKQRFVFLCGKWLSLENDDETIDAVLPVCGKENVTTFANMFYLNAKENLAESHIWVSIFFRPTSSHFTRCQRVTCLLVFIMMSMIANAIYFRPADDYENPGLVRVGALVFSLQSVYVSIVSALISTPTVFLVILLFRKSKPKSINTDINDPSLKYAIPAIDSVMEKLLKESKELEKALVAKGIIKLDGTILPFWCGYLAWFISLAGSATTGFFLLLYSMEWGKQKSEMWLTQFFLSFFEASALLDPLKVILMAAVFAFIFTQLEKFKPSPLKRSLILKNYRQRFSCETDIRMPAPQLNQEALEKARRERRREIQMVNALKECIVTCIFLWIIYSISYSNRDNRSYMIHSVITNQFIIPASKPAFTSIGTTAALIEWLSVTAFPALFPAYEYNGEKMHWRWRQYVSDLTNFRVGPPRLRQLRVVHEYEDYPVFGKMIYFPGYSFVKEDDADYCFDWKSTPCDLKKESWSFSYRAWKYTNALDIWGIPVSGYYTTYGGGGYIAELDVNWDFSNRTLNELNTHFWIDRHTRAIFLEFTVYSANLNIFTYVMLMAEFPETGGVTTMYTIYPMRIFQHHGNTGVYMIFCEVVFLFFLTILMLRVIYYLHKKKKAFFHDAWRCVDFVCVIGGLISVAMYFGRMLMAKETMANFAKDPKNFVNFQHLALWDLLFVVILAALVFLATFRVVGILGYDKRIGEVFRVVDNCARELFWFGTLFFYIFMGYAMLGVLLFGRALNAYKNIFDTFGTLFISMIGKSKFTELNEQDPLMAQLYFFTYILLIVYVMLTMFLAILCESIARVHEMTKADRSQELVEFIIDEIKRIFSKGKKKQPILTNAKSDKLNSGEPIDVLTDLRSDISSILEEIPGNNQKPPLPPENSSIAKR